MNGRRVSLVKAGLPLALPALATLLVAGCLSTVQPVGSLVADLEQQIQRRGLDPEEILLPQVLSVEARRWLRSKPSLNDPHRPAQQRLQELLNSLTGSRGPEISYDNAVTGTAGEVFASGRANCLGFMNLFIGMAREMGIDAFYLAIDDVSSFGREGDLIVVADHVAAGFGSRRDMLVLDFTTDQPPSYEDVHPLSDLQALAQFYSNRGAERLRAGEPEEALDWLVKAVRLEPDFATSWANLGVARRRAGDLEGAEAAYRQALEIDPRGTSAYHNFAALLRLRGELERARELLALTDRLDNRNPYNYLNLGDWSLEAGEFVAARRFFRRALRLEPANAEPYAALGEVEAASGHRSRAQRWLRRARRRNAEEPRVRRLETVLRASLDRSS